MVVVVTSLGRTNKKQRKRTKDERLSRRSWLTESYGHTLIPDRPPALTERTERNNIKIKKKKKRLWT